MNPIDRLSTLLKKLAPQAKLTDEKNANAKVHRLIENTDLFSAELFVTKSDRFSPYIKEVERKLSEFTRLTTAGRSELSALLLEQIEHQILAISNAIHANSTLHQAAKLSFDAHQKAKIKKKNTQQKFKSLAQKLTLSSHQLYQKLNETLEFERRLMDMVAEREAQRLQCKASENTKLSAEVLALHQRLGRCRKAISSIERDIEQSEKRG